MGSDLGHENEDVFQFFTSEEWSRGEKQSIRLILSHRYGSILLSIMMEFIFYHYAVHTYVSCIYVVEVDFSSLD